LQKWLDDWAVPLIDRIELACNSWESVIDRVSQVRREHGASLGEFYNRCLKYNVGARVAAAATGR
jgi:hypothetical protein